MNIFNTVKVRKPSFSRFDLSYDLKISMKMGQLVPVHVQECLPGDIFRQRSEAMFRMMPLIAPIMQKVDIFFHTFFVPNRILWPGWEEFITGGSNADITRAMPRIPVGTVPASSLKNYLGLPISTTNKATNINALPFAAYQRIWYEFYRDQNLEQGVSLENITLSDGVQVAPSVFTEMRRRAWEHDYFTACLPFAQKGSPVDLPIDLTNVEIIAEQPTGFNPLMRFSTNGSAAGATGQPVKVNGFGSTVINDGSAEYPIYYDPQGTLKLDNTDSASATINDLRTAFALQKWLEKNARAGTRYSESVFAHFGVKSPDKRLQRPEYLGGSKATMAISEVLQTSSSDGTSPQANMAGHGISVSGGKDYSYRCEEHGYIMTICSIRPKSAYYNGLPRHFAKSDRYDFYWPDFAFIGEQPVYNKELLFKGTAEDNDTFGYLPPFSEYRYNQSRVAGEMATSLEYWHQGRKFSDTDPHPTLSSEFIQCNPTKRIFAVEDSAADEIVAHIFHQIEARRPLPKYGTPAGV